jgi:cyclase
MKAENNIRIIPRLDIKGPNLVKGIHLEGLRVLGKPEVFAQHYYETGADELMFVDVVASLYDRNSLHDIITQTAKKIFIPLTVSGGLRSIKDINSVLRAGADKVSLNTAAVKNPELIKQASREFGSSTIVITLETIKQSNGQYLIYTDNGREHTGIEALEWAKRVEELGAGELIITSVDQEGCGEGFDTDLIKLISSHLSIPVIAHGGAGNAEHVYEAIKKGKADAVAIASILHYQTIHDVSKHVGFEEEGNLEFLNSGSSFSKITPAKLTDIKKFLYKNDVLCRYDNYILEKK